MVSCWLMLLMLYLPLVDICATNLSATFKNVSHTQSSMYRGGWNTQHVPNLNDRGTDQFSNGPDHWKTKLLDSLDHFVCKENYVDIYVRV